MVEFKFPPLPSGWTIKPARKQGQFVKIPGGRIHSKYDSHREAENRLPASTDHSRYIVMGAGLGYILSILAERDPQANIILFEPNPSLLNEGLKRGVWNPNQLPNLQLVPGESNQLLDQIGDFFSLQSPTDYQLIQWDLYEQRFSQFFNEVLTHLEKAKTMINKNRDILLDQGKQWLRNTRKNLPLFYYHQSPLISTYEGPIAFISAGPSLDEQIPWLRENQEGLLVIVGNTAGPILKNHDPTIKADFHSAVDANRPVGQDLLNSDINHLWSSPFLHPEALRQNQDHLSILAIQTPVTEWLCTADFLPTILPGGAISATILRWLHDKTGQPLYMLGCDMEIRNGRYYARGTHREQQQLSRLSRFYSLPQWHLIDKLKEKSEDPLSGERAWFVEQSLDHKRLKIPMAPPSWWDGNVDGDLLEPCKSEMEHQTVDVKEIHLWFQHQYEQFHSGLAGRKTTPEWELFFQWNELILDEPGRELKQWKKQLSDVTKDLP